MPDVGTGCGGIPVEKGLLWLVYEMKLRVGLEDDIGAIRRFGNEQRRRKENMAQERRVLVVLVAGLAELG